MIQTIAFLLVLGFPFIVYLINMAIAQREQRGGIAAGIPKPKEAKMPRGSRAARPAKVRSTRVQYCGRGFTHLALALVGSSQSCRHCSYIQQEPTPLRREPGPDDDSPNMPPPPEAEDDRQAAIREAEEIIERWKP